MQKSLTEEEIVHLCSLIKKGEAIPLKYKEMFFGKETEKKEYELKYACKERYEDVIANSFACPLQKIKTFEADKIIDHKDFVRGPETKAQFHDGWYNKLIFGDNLQVMKTLLFDPLLQKQIKENGGIKLIYIDPPFATKSDFQSGKGEKAYTDKVAGAEFIEFIRKRLILMRELLAEDGSIYVHLDDKKCHYIKIIMDEIFGENNFQNEVVWHYKSFHGQVKKYFPKKHDMIYFYKKTDHKLFHLERNKEVEIEEMSDFKNWGKYIVNDNEIRGNNMPIDVRFKRNIDKWLKLNPGQVPGKNDVVYIFQSQSYDDVWDISYLDPKDKVERLDYPTQKPEALLERIVRASSNKGDIVLDAFGGSGTTLAVAEKLGRKWIGIDCGKLAIYTIQKRLLNLKIEIGNKGEKITPKPFAVYNAGLYDFKVLSNLDWKTYKWFVLALFQCKQEEHKIQGVLLDGFLGLDHVQVFDFNHGREGISMDYAYLTNLDNKIGEKVGKTVFVIAPASRVDFLETVVTVGKREYHILRVPYSIINDLYTNKRDFEKLIQPTSEDDVNNTVDAVGFDFVQSPKVEVKYTLKKDHALIHLKTFESKILSKKPTNYANLETLSMVIIDYEYDSQSFNFEQVLFAHEIKGNDYVITLDAKRLKTDCMIIWIDIFGNEKREIINLKNFK